MKKSIHPDQISSQQSPAPSSASGPPNTANGAKPSPQNCPRSGSGKRRNLLADRRPHAPFREWLKHAWRASAAHRLEAAARFRRHLHSALLPHSRTPLWLMLALALASAAIAPPPKSARRWTNCVAPTAVPFVGNPKTGPASRNSAKFRNRIAIRRFSHCSHCSPTIRQRTAGAFGRSHPKRSIADMARLRNLAKNLAGNSTPRLVSRTNVSNG